MNKIKIGVFALGVCMVVGMTSVNAQDVTDQDLKDYAVIELAKTSIIRSISPWVQSYLDKYNEAQTAPENKITTDRWKKLEATGGDDAKLTAMGANVGEKDITKKIMERVNKKKKAAGQVVKLLASNGMGAKAYKATKTAIASNPDMKVKYEPFLAARK